MTDGADTIGQVRVDVAELKGIVTTVITDYGRRLSESENVSRQLRVDLTAVNENIHNRINTLVAEGNIKGSAIETAITKNTSSIEDIKVDVADLHAKHNNAGTRLATYVTPFISIAALIITAYALFTHH